MNTDYELLTEKDAMWAEMLIEVLENNDIPCAAVPVSGAGLVITTGTQDRLRVYVPGEDIPRAKELLEGMFSENEEP